MDKDSVILIHDQIEIDNISGKIDAIRQANIRQTEQLGAMQVKLTQMYKLIGKEPNRSRTEYERSQSVLTNSSTVDCTYEDLYQNAMVSLIERGLDVNELDYHDLVSEKDLNELKECLNRPLSKREKWNRNDFIAIFIAASIGSLADIILGKRNNTITGADPRNNLESQFSAKLNLLHIHESGAPIDYQGPGFGGGFHRGLSKGHDLLRFIEAIYMFKEGRFEGIRYESGEAIRVIYRVNQYSKPYEQLSYIDAICRYAKHMYADLFSTCSLPFPGYSFLVESDNCQLRRFAVDMYQNGFNCKNILVQGISTAIIEIILRTYFSIESVRNTNCDLEIYEDYSNWNQMIEFIKPQNKEKLYEMLLVAHSIVTAVNIGKVVIKKSPWELNITEIISVVKYGVKIISQRNEEYGKIIRNAEEVHMQWEAIERELIELGEISTYEKIEPLIIA